MQMTRISIPVSIEEREALRQLARRESRHPRDQARHILRLALIGNDEQFGNFPPLPAEYDNKNEFHIMRCMVCDDQPLMEFEDADPHAEQAHGAEYSSELCFSDDVIHTDTAAWHEYDQFARIGDVRFVMYSRYKKNRGFDTFLAEKISREVEVYGRIREVVSYEAISKTLDNLLSSTQGKAVAQAGTSL